MSLKEQNELIKNEIVTFNARRSLIVAAIIILAALLFNLFLPEDPADLGKTMAFLVSPEASGICGQLIFCDAGTDGLMKSESFL